ncbi:S-layer homology domain-containing protein [bacterium]|nr:S-layer homology domain-containing protein [bacterium]
MKKIIAGVLTFFLCLVNFLPAFADVITIADVTEDYWAATEVAFVLDKSLMFVDSNGYFRPESPITRIDFVHALLKVLSNDNLDVTIENIFSDVKETDYYYADVLRSEQLGIVYGYPDGTFKPHRMMLRSEVTSVMSHITKDMDADGTILRYFKDYKTIPDWALRSYAKAINYDLYVNHPDERMLEPNRNITRAEVAVLLYKLYQKLNLVKPEYKNVPDEPDPERILRVEHLDVLKDAPNNEVTITNLRKIILRGNVLKIYYDQDYASSKSTPGEIVNFIFKDDVYTKEGTLVIPKGSRTYGEVIKVLDPEKLNTNAAVYMIFKKIDFPDGRSVEIKAIPFTEHNVLEEGPLKSFAKVAGWTVAGAGAGAGAGIGLGATANAIGRGLAIGLPIGSCVGLLTGMVTPGLNYRASKGEAIYIILTEDVSIEIVE